MTGAELVQRKLGVIEACLADLRRLADPERIERDVVHERFVLHTLQIAIQAVIDVASHIVSSERLGEPSSSTELATRLEQHGWLDKDVAASARRMIAFRNLVVHGYAEVDLARVKAILGGHLGEIDAFVSAIRRRLSDEPESGGCRDS